MWGYPGLALYGAAASRPPPPLKCTSSATLMPFPALNSSIEIQYPTVTSELTPYFLRQRKRHLRRFDRRDEGNDNIDFNWHDGAAVLGISKNSPDNGTLIKARNMTGYWQNISVGTLQAVGSISVYSSSFMWKLGFGYLISASHMFNSILDRQLEPDHRSGLSPDAQVGQNEIITADIASDELKDWNMTGRPGKGFIPHRRPMRRISLSNRLSASFLRPGGHSIFAMAALTMVKEIAPKGYEDLNLHFAPTVCWQDSVSRHVVIAAFFHISSTLATKGLSYHEEHHDNERYRKRIVSQKGVTWGTLSATLKRTIVEALEKESAINGKALTPADFDYYWATTEERGVNVRRSDGEEIISDNSAASFHISRNLSLFSEGNPPEFTLAGVLPLFRCYGSVPSIP
ncbi:hypothetical protein B0H19DRAFT_1274788 [Mycena capillaripes]|nr:hypothetical protein B0H19DRAFT_1274788 [Mycena capillaripes]